MLFPLNRKVVLASAIAMASQVSFVQAAGYGINEQSASYLGTGFAGRASNAIDASISVTNPAGISFLEGGRQISVGADVILEGGSFDGEYTRADNSVDASTDDFQKTSFVPFGYFVMPMDEKWSFGLAGYAPYGIELDYANGWGGDYFANKTSVKVINLQGTLSYKLSDDLALGFGLIGSHVVGELTQKTWLMPGYMAGDASIKGDDNTLGWNVGAIWNATPSTTLGLAYHSQLEFKLKGDFDVENIHSVIPNIPPIFTTPLSSDANLDITMPEKLMLSATHRLNGRWVVMADATWTRWSRFEEFRVTSSNDQLGSYIPMNWKNTWALSLGSSYQLNDQWLLRAGYMFDQSPVTSDTRTVRSPDANRNWFTFGANMKLAENMNVDFAYAYVKLQDGSINEPKYDKSTGQPDDEHGVVTGEYSSGSHIFGAQFNYKF